MEYVGPAASALGVALPLAAKIVSERGCVHPEMTEAAVKIEQGLDTWARAYEAGCTPLQIKPLQVAVERLAATYSEALQASRDHDENVKALQTMRVPPRPGFLAARWSAGLFTTSLNELQSTVNDEIRTLAALMLVGVDSELPARPPPTGLTGEAPLHQHVQPLLAATVAVGRVWPIAFFGQARSGKTFIISRHMQTRFKNDGDASGWTEAEMLLSRRHFDNHSYVATQGFDSIIETVGAFQGTWTSSAPVFKYYDVSGRKAYECLSSKVAEHAGGLAAAAIVYDVTSADSFADCQHFYELSQKSQKTKCMLVGTKLDLVESDSSRRQVPLEDAKEFAGKYNMPFIEVNSVRDASSSVEDMFKQIQQLALSTTAHTCGQPASCPSEIPADFATGVLEVASRRRWCKVCLRWKPDDVHHCGRCNGCFYFQPRCSNCDNKCGLARGLQSALGVVFPLACRST